MPRKTTYRFHQYHTRLMASLALSLAVLVAAFQLWPVAENDEPSQLTYRTKNQERPPPPAPPIPIVVPDDVILQEDELDLSESFVPVEDPGDALADLEGAPDDGTVSAPGPTVAPKTVRFVEPEYTREARRRKIRAELVVEVLVDERGRVQTTKVLERFLLEGNGEQKTPVTDLGYGLEEAAISAAERWVFRPARKDGRAVAAYTTLTFTFGV